MKKTIKTIEEMVSDCKQFGTNQAGWILANENEVPEIQKVLKPSTKAWVRKVYVFPRKENPSVKLCHFCPM